MVIHNDEIKKIQKACFDLIKDSDFEPAMRLIQTLLEQDPNDAIALNFLGIIHLEMRNFHLA